MLKRYLVFGYDEYYPGGGWDDFLGSFDTIEEARKVWKGDHRQIVDGNTGEIVERD